MSLSTTEAPPARPGQRPIRDKQPAHRGRHSQRDLAARDPDMTDLARYDPVQPDREYIVATTDFTANSQAAPEELNTTGLVFSKTGPLQRDAVVDWVRTKKTLPTDTSRSHAVN